VVTSQLCKTNPISEKPKPLQPLVLQGLIRIFRSAKPEKNKPKQTQSRYTGKASRIEYPASSIQPCLCKTNPMSKMGKMTISTTTTKAYANEQRTMINERYSKQTQSNPISPPHAVRHPTSIILP
jgi:hypothetical protein